MFSFVIVEVGEFLSFFGNSTSESLISHCLFSAIEFNSGESANHGEKKEKGSAHVTG